MSELIRVSERVAEHGIRISTVESNVAKVQASVDTLEGSVQRLKEVTEDRFAQVDSQLSGIATSVTSIADDISTGRPMHAWVVTQIEKDQREEGRRHAFRRKIYGLAPLGVAVLSGPLIPQLAVWFAWSVTTGAIITVAVYGLAVLLTVLHFLRDPGTPLTKPTLPPILLPSRHLPPRT